MVTRTAVLRRFQSRVNLQEQSFHSTLRRTAARFSEHLSLLPDGPSAEHEMNFVEV